ESKTDTFARIEEPINETPPNGTNGGRGANGHDGGDQGQGGDGQSGSSPAGVPGQQRTGLRAFAERAMGGR
ncbi:MAG: hypothetical protein ABWZ02_13860, partial [Nakamurella sp.]